MLETLNSIWFATRIRLLDKRVSNILTSVHTMSQNKDEVESVEREINTCSAMLKQLLEYAKNNRVMSQEDYDVSAKTAEKLKAAKDILEERKISWWKKILSKIIAILPVIGELLILASNLLKERNPRTALLVAGISGIIGFLPSSND